eukprot:COSAG01_NODE_33000_length_571_cov_7.849576_1_plen_146_part_01
MPCNTSVRGTVVGDKGRRSGQLIRTCFECNKDVPIKRPSRAGATSTTKAFKCADCVKKARTKICVECNTEVHLTRPSQAINFRMEFVVPCDQVADVALGEHCVEVTLRGLRMLMSLTAALGVGREGGAGQRGREGSAHHVSLLPDD